MSNDSLPAVEKTIFSTHNLIAALVAVAGLTFGLFVWDAERALDKLDKVDVNSGQTAAQVQVLVDKVGDIGKRQDMISGVVTDHEKRITVLETVEGVKTKADKPK
ncbi:hypothetical protein GC176_20475 [bacterium]|nr:hypothetical protein [bacterium]